MQRRIALILIFMLVILTQASAQTDTPKYRYSTYPRTGTYLLYTNAYCKTQCFYSSAQFPGLAAGPIKALYFRLLQPFYEGNPSQAVFPRFTVKMGYADSFSFVGPQTTNYFKTGLTTVYGPATLALSAGANAYQTGNWLRIPITKNGFSYNPEKKFIVEVSMGPRTKQGGMYFASSAGDGVNWPLLMSSDGIGDSASSYVVSRSFTDLGIEPGQPNLAVGEASGTGKAFMLYPNPATRTFTISLSAGKPLGAVDVTLSNVPGQVVMHNSYRADGNDFTTDIDAGKLPRGLYFLKLEADSEVLTQKLVLE